MGIVKIYDQNDKYLIFLGINDYEYVKFSNILFIFKNVVVLIEDCCFYKYKGVDYYWIFGVVVGNLKGSLFGM